MSEPFSVVDLFCGAGGMSLGFRANGFNIVHATDCWSPAVESYRSNLGDHVSDTPITDTTRVNDATVIVGGPPCQGFSSAGARRREDDRNDLVSVFARLIARHRPLAFVFENVEGFVTADEGRYVSHLLDPLIEAGYYIHLRKINAANYGVPQHRKRFIGMGGLGWAPSFPRPTHSAWGMPGAIAHAGLPLTPTLFDAIAGLPCPATLNPSDGRDHNHPALNEVDLSRARLLKPGQSMRDLPEVLWHESYRRRAFRRVMDGTPTERRGGAPSGVRRLAGDAPCKAITGGAQSEFLHPTEDRPLTLRECARIQTFPDTFNFSGTRAEKLQQIGNAVPPRLASVIAASLRADLENLSINKSGRGALLSFKPTGASAMSPVLHRVCNEISAKYKNTSMGLFTDAIIKT